MTVDISGIMAVLPHRYPFLLVDRIVEFNPGERVVGIKNVTMNEPYFAGHFPGNPVMPGVLIVEAMAQTGAVMAIRQGGDAVVGKFFYLAGVDKARFRRPVVPGDQLRLELTVLSLRRSSCRMAGRATVDGELAAEATLLSLMVDPETGASR
ncbi:MAG TPA: 3-hydroxyacyl-ACP dehydratase FabZ [Acidobacteriota bacterium]|nr:3-hydroxyacyl-ACP dehydratase FabZ [Acidobacteriota bacterium]